MGKNKTLPQLLRSLRGDMPLREASKLTGISHTYLNQLEKGIDPRSGKEIKPSAETLKRLSTAYDYPYEKLLVAAGYLSVQRPGRVMRVDEPSTEHITDKESHKKITNSVSDDPELVEFWNQLQEREDLQVFLKQVKDMTPQDIKRVIRILKFIEEEEADDDSL